MTDSYDSSAPFRHYKRVRNLIRKFEPKSIIRHAIRALHKSHHGGVSAMTKAPPWNLLLLIKWVAQEADGISHTRPAASIDEFRKITALLHDMADQVRTPSAFSHVSLFMRQLAFQQFHLQHSVGRYALARQEIIFSGLQSNHLFQSEFERITGVRYNDFNELSIGLISLLLSEPTVMVVRKSDFRLLEPKLAPFALDNFFSFLGRTLPELHNWLSSEAQKKKNVEDEWLLPSPLGAAPLWNDDGKFVV